MYFVKFLSKIISILQNQGKNYYNNVFFRLFQKVFKNYLTSSTICITVQSEKPPNTIQSENTHPSTTHQYPKRNPPDRKHNSITNSFTPLYKIQYYTHTKIQHTLRNDEANSTSKESKLPPIQRLRIGIPANKHFIYYYIIIYEEGTNPYRCPFRQSAAFQEDEGWKPA